MAGAGSVAVIVGAYQVGVAMGAVVDVEVVVAVVVAVALDVVVGPSELVAYLVEMVEVVAVAAVGAAGALEGRVAVDADLVPYANGVVAATFACDVGVSLPLAAADPGQGDWVVAGLQPAASGA